MFRSSRFLSLALLTAPALPAADVPPVPISVQCDWIRLPLAAANALIRQHLKSTGATALHDAVVAMLKTNAATRLDVQSLLTSAGKYSKVVGITEKSYATEFDPPQLSQTLSVDGDWPYDMGIPACAGSYTFHNLGREVEVETGLRQEGPPLQLRLAASWSEHLTEVPYGIGISFYPEPSFYEASVLADLHCASGVWQLAGLFTPPPDKKEEAETAPLPGDRVLLFARATASGLKPHAPPPPDSEPAMRPVLVEWIEADTALIADLLEATADFTSAAGLRASLEAPIAAGTAALIETAFVPMSGREQAKISSVRWFAYVTEVDPAQVPQTLIVTNHTPAGSPLPGGGVSQPLMTPSFFNSYSGRELGTVLEVRCTPQDDGETVSLELAAELSALAGGDVFDQGVSEVPQPRYHSLYCTTQIAVRTGVPALAGLLDSSLPSGQSHPAVRTRKVLLFVTVLP